MEISSAAVRIVEPVSRANTDPVIESLKKAKENLSDQMQKLKQDKTVDEKSKQEKIKQLQTQMDELEKQIQNRQQEKMLEDSQKASESDNSLSNTNSKTAEERKKDAQAEVEKSLISASVHEEHLTRLGAVRKRLLAEDGGYSERVKRTEGLMGKQAVQINSSIKENEEALKDYNKSSREVADNEQAARNLESRENMKNDESIAETGSTGTEHMPSDSSKESQAAENNGDRQHDAKQAEAEKVPLEVPQVKQRAIRNYKEHAAKSSAAQDKSIDIVL